MADHAQSEERSQSLVNPSQERSRILESSAQDGVIETNIEDLEDVCAEIESNTIYSLRAETLKGWAMKLRIVHEQLSRRVDPNGLDQSKRIHSMRTQSHFQMSHLAGSSMRRRETNSQFKPKADVVSPCSTFAAHISSTTHVIADNICHMIQADWVTCFVYNESLKKLVLVAGAGKKQAKPGEVTLNSNSGLESTVMESGIAIGTGSPATEAELLTELENNPVMRSRSVLCFPLFKPGSTTSVVGVLEARKVAGDRPFSVDDENRFAECAFFLAHLLSRFPNDITNPVTLDSSAFSKPRDSGERQLHLSGRHPQLIYRTGHHHPRKADVLREAQQLQRSASVQSVLEHAAFVSEAWRSSVLLNIELEHEVRRLHEALRVARREIARLQGVVNERKGKNSVAL